MPPQGGIFTIVPQEASTMREDAYYGHASQLFGVEEHRLVGGRGDGMRLLQVKNGLGLEFTVSTDRCCDISRLSYGGCNFGFFSANGYVAPAHYDDREDGWLKGFTAGFLTTCGLSNVGVACTDQGRRYGLHGELSYTPAERVSWDWDDEAITVRGTMNCARIFSSKLSLNRTIRCSRRENVVTITDVVRNAGGRAEPVLLLYHCNLGYPLLQECSQIHIPSLAVEPRDPWAAEGMGCWDRIPAPEPGFSEQCYRHRFEKNGTAGIFNPMLDRGVLLTFDAENLPYFTQWKLMDVKDYVLGLEPANCHVMGRDVMRRESALQMVEAGGTAAFSLNIRVAENRAAWDDLLQNENI